MKWMLKPLYIVLELYIVTNLYYRQDLKPVNQNLYILPKKKESKSKGHIFMAVVEMHGPLRKASCDA